MTGEADLDVEQAGDDSVTDESMLVHERLLGNPLTLKDEIAREKASRRFRDYVRYAWPYVDSNPLAEGFYIDALAEHLEAVLIAQIRHLIISIRPKLGKSTIGLVLFPNYVWIRERQPGTFYGPQTRLFTTSYSDTLCERDSAKARWLLESSWSQSRWPIAMRRDQNQKNEYYNMAGGYRRAVPLRGQITGAGGDIVIADDSLSFRESLSQAERNKVFDLLNGAVMAQRIDLNSSPAIWYGQRLHVDDPIGRMLKDVNQAKDIDYLCLQTIRRLHQVPPMHRFWDYATDQMVEREIPASGITCTVLTRTGRWADPRAEGECIAPTRIGRQEIERLQRHVEVWAAQDMQDPLPPTEGRYFQGFNMETSVCDASQMVSLDPDDGWEFWLGGDHGDGRGKEVIVLLAVHHGQRKIVIVDAYISQSSTSAAQDAIGIMKLLDRNAVIIRRITRFVADINRDFKGDGEAINEQLSRELGGIQIDAADKSSGTVATGELLMNLAFRNATLFIDEALQDGITAFSTYVQGAKAFKDFIDACRYPLYEILNLWVFGEGTSELY